MGGEHEGLTMGECTLERLSEGEPAVVDPLTFSVGMGQANLARDDARSTGSSPATDRLG